jgi:hypothetical protein
LSTWRRAINAKLRQAGNQLVCLTNGESRWRAHSKAIEAPIEVPIKICGTTPRRTQSNLRSLTVVNLVFDLQGPIVSSVSRGGVAQMPYGLIARQLNIID